MSLITTDWFCVEEFPLLSVKVQVTVVEAVIGNVVKVVPVMVPLQLSVAVGGVILFTWHCSFTVGKVVRSATGAVVSRITTDWFCVELFPLPSVKVQITVVEVVTGKAVVVVPVMVPSQLSVAVGGVMLIT